MSDAPEAREDEEGWAEVMTTSLLMYHGGELSDFDLHVLSDYAIEAPWEWRKALERLIEAARREGDEEELEAQLDDWKGRALEAREKLIDLLEKMPDVVTGKERVEIDRAVLERLEEVLAEVAEDLKEEPKAEPKPKEKKRKKK
jgi:exonuclease V gamma subunit